MAAAWERYERPITIGDTSYLAMARIGGQDSPAPQANLTVTADAGQLQLQAPITNLGDWQDALGEAIDSVMLAAAPDEGGDPYPNTSTRWREEDIQRLKALWRQRNSETYRWIGRMLGRRPGAIQTQLRDLRLLVSRPPEAGDPPAGTTPPGSPPPPPPAGDEAVEAVVEEPPAETPGPRTAGGSSTGADQSGGGGEGHRRWGSSFRH